jgi:N-acyl homoserine lactone hydrolase
MCLAAVKRSCSRPAPNMAPADHAPPQWPKPACAKEEVVRHLQARAGALRAGTGRGVVTSTWTNAGELHYAAEARDGKVFRTVSQGHEIHQYEFASAPYLGFSSSYDVHGDGSVVVAPAGGHTTGSVIVFVTLPTGKRYALIGDVAWQLEGARRPAERPLMMRKLADADPGQVRQDLLRVASLAGLMQIIPAHDLTAYERTPRLTPRTASSVS